MMKKIYAILLFLGFVSCVNHDLYELPLVEQAPMLKVDLVSNDMSVEATRAAGANDFKNLNVYVTDLDGNVMVHRYYDEFSGTTLTFPGVVGQSKLFVLANIGSVVIIIENIERFRTYGTNFKDTIPMYANSEILDIKPAVTTDEVVEIDPLYFTRYTAKVTTTFDYSALDCGTTITPTKIALRQIPTHCYLIGENAPFQIGFSHLGDSIQNNLNPSTHYDATPLYCFENMQGTGTYTNEKVPPTGRHYYCSYLEITAEHCSAAGTQTVLYKHYIGNNETDNFDVARNTWYRYTVHFVDDGGIGSDLWSVELL